MFKAALTELPTMAMVLDGIWKVLSLVANVLPRS